MSESPSYTCPVCGSESTRLTRYRVPGLLLLECPACHLIFQRAPQVPATLYSHEYYSHWSPDESGYPAGVAKIATASRLLASLVEANGGSGPGGRLLDIGCAHGQLLEAARARGLRPEGVEISPAADFARSKGFPVFSGPLEAAPFGPGRFDFVTMVDVIEHVADPLGLLRRVRFLLRDHGRLLILTPDARSLSARLLRGRWPHFKGEHLVYFSRSSVRAALGRSGFRPLAMHTGTKYLSFDYTLADLERYGRMPLLARIVVGLGGLVPTRVRRTPVPLPSDLGVIAEAVSAD